MKMWDVLRKRVLGADGTSVDRRSGSRLAEGIVTAVEVFAFFKLFGKVIGLGGEFAVETEKFRLLWRERADVDLVLLVGVHFGLIFGRAVMMRVSVISGNGL